MKYLMTFLTEGLAGDFRLDVIVDDGLCYFGFLFPRKDVRVVRKETKANIVENLREALNVVVHFKIFSGTAFPTLKPITDADRISPRTKRIAGTDVKRRNTIFPLRMIGTVERRNDSILSILLHVKRTELSSFF